MYRWVVESYACPARPLARKSADGSAEPGSRLGQPADHRAIILVHPDEEATHAQETLEANEGHRDGYQRQQAQPEEESGADPEITEPRHHTARAAETGRMIWLRSTRRLPNNLCDLMNLPSPCRIFGWCSE